MDGEVFTAHFHRGSVLNWLFGYRPEENLRSCYSFRDGGECLPLAYSLPER